MSNLRIRSSRKIKFIFIALILLALTASVVKKGKVIVIEDKQSGVYEEIYLEDNSFVLSYTHSVHKTIFEEYFIVTQDNMFLLQKNVFDSFGVGSPYIDNFENFRIENNKFVYILNKTFEDINMIISPIPEHKLTTGDRVYDIIDLLNEDTNSIKLYPIEKYIIVIGKTHKIL